MSLSLTTGNRDRIALLVYGKVYSGLDTEQKTLLDAAGSVPNATPGGFAGDAMLRVKQMSQYLAQSASTSAPDEAEPWFVVETAYLIALNARPERVPLLKASRDAAARDFETTYTTKSITYDETADPSAFAFTMQAMRKGIIASCIRRNPPFYPAVDDVDASLYWALNSFWNRKKWNFRRRQVAITFDTSSAATFDLATTEAFDSLSTRKLYFSDSDARGSITMDWADADEMAKFQSAIDGGQATGRPQRFRVERQGTSLVWQLFPEPNTTYTTRGECLIKGPAAIGTSTTDFTTYLAKVPTELQTLVRQMALGKLLVNNNQPGGAEVLRNAEDEVERMAPDYEDLGDGDADAAVRDFYGDITMQRGWNQIGGGL